MPQQMPATQQAPAAKAGTDTAIMAKADNVFRNFVFIKRPPKSGSTVSRLKPIERGKLNTLAARQCTPESSRCHF
jgi:hypothetical protein